MEIHLCTRRVCLLAGADQWWEPMGIQGQARGVGSLTSHWEQPQEMFKVCWDSLQEQALRWEQATRLSPARREFCTPFLGFLTFLVIK